MGTRALLVFEDEFKKFKIYKNMDGYPESVLNQIENSLKYAWKLPRFEADDFAAAFIAANKTPGGGGLYLAKTEKDDYGQDYTYTVKYDGEFLIVNINGSEQVTIPREAEGGI